MHSLKNLSINQQTYHAFLNNFVNNIQIGTFVDKFITE